ncbi:MAG: winged helix-turn-helix transcriptional regulator [Aestuariibaculum sp.]
MKEKSKRSKCPISGSLDIWGDKWSLLIIRDLMLNGQCTYGDFQKSEEGIASNILASKLKILMANGIVEKLKHPESKAKVLYQLTEKGIDLMPLIIEINLWAEKYYSIPTERKTMLKEVKKDRDWFIKTKSTELKKLLVKK